jgi:hypothetical protein
MAPGRWVSPENNPSMNKENDRMARAGTISVLSVLAALSLGGCLVPEPISETRAKIGLIEQVERQQTQIEALEQEVAELWWRSEQVRIDTLVWEIEQLRTMTQDERIEALEWKIAELEGM